MTGQEFDPQTLNILAGLIGTVGFPVFIATWVIVRTDKVLERLVVAVEALKECVDHLNPNKPQ